MIGQLIDERYRIDLLLGEGGMGAVYRTFDTGLQRQVALKVMHQHLAREESFRQRFLQEAQAAARLDHPSIVPIFDFKSSPDALYIVMAYIPGLSLRQALRRLHERDQSIDLEEAVRVMAQVAEALDYAHRQGVVHRDIKPDNVLLRPLEEPDPFSGLELRAVVTDFGLAKLTTGEWDTQTNAPLMGTLPYMAPEHVLEQPVDGRSDLYSVGVMLFELVTGQVPYRLRTPVEAVRQHMNPDTAPPDPKALRASVSPSLTGLLQKAIAREAEDRFQSGADMAVALNRVADEIVGQYTQVAAEAADSVVSLIVTLPPPASVEKPARQEPDLPAKFPAEALPEPSSAAGARPGPEQLVIYCGEGSPQAVRLTQTILTLGRGSDNDVILLGTGISRQHARLERIARGWLVTDLESTNGTLLAGRPLISGRPATWPAGVDLQIGPCVLYWGEQGKSDPALSPVRRPIPAVPRDRRKGMRLPTWLMITGGILLLAICIAASSLFVFFGERDSEATATVRAIAALTAESQTRRAEASQATATARVGATQTVEMARLLGDDDDDGLSNQAEREAGTDPDNPDSDDDGLSDGDEVNRYETDPLQADTDGDGREDGQEVEEGTDPTVAETVTPTPTSTETLTPTPSHTPSPSSTPTLTPTPTETPTPTMTWTPSPTPIIFETWSPTFRLIGGQTNYLFQVDGPGTVLVRYSWSEEVVVRLSLFEEGSANPEATIAGDSPLELSQSVASGEDTWRLVMSLDEGEAADGSLTLLFPNGGNDARLVSESRVDEGAGQAYALLPLPVAAPISAQVSWSGVAPSQVSQTLLDPQGISQDSDTGPPPLLVRYGPSDDEFVSGAVWRISLDSIGVTNAFVDWQLTFPTE